MRASSGTYMLLPLDASERIGIAMLRGVFLVDGTNQLGRAI